jgi:hypothetical protein
MESLADQAFCVFTAEQSHYFLPMDVAGIHF